LIHDSLVIAIALTQQITNYNIARGDVSLDTDTRITNLSGDKQRKK